jgi:hypothetical protein
VETGCGRVESIQLAQDKGRWRAVVSAVMNLLDLAARVYPLTHPFDPFRSYPPNQKLFHPSNHPNHSNPVHLPTHPSIHHILSHYINMLFNCSVNICLI